ncbi:YhdP family protein [Rhodovibrionaceae bacterium A322]
MECLIGLFVLLAVLVGVALWRLSSGPVQVNFLTPYLENSFASISQGFSISIDEMVIAWPSYQKSLKLQARNWKTLDPNGQVLASAPLVDVSLSLPALVQGVIAPTEIGIYGAELLITRNADGHFVFQRHRSMGVQSPEVAEAQDELAPSTPAAGTDTGLEVVLPGSTAETEGDSSADASSPGATGIELPEITDEDGLQAGDRVYSHFVRQMLDQIKAAPNLENPASFLHEVNFQGGLEFVDKQMDIIWQAPDAELSVRRQGEDLAADVSLQLDMAGVTTSAEFGLLYNDTTGIMDVVLTVDDFAPNFLAQIDEQLKVLRGVQLPLDGRFSFQIDDAKGHLSDLSFDLVGHAGRIVLPRELERPLGVQSLSVKGHYSDEKKLLVLEQAKTVFASETEHKPHVTMSGQVQFSEQATDLSISAEVQDLAADELAAYWPLKAVEGGRAWVTQFIRQGTADQAWVKLDMSLPTDAETEPDIKLFEGGVSYSNLLVDYLNPMPPITGVSGTGTFALDELTFSPVDGVAAGVGVPKADVRIFDLNETPRIGITFTAAGDFKSALLLLNHPRMALVERLGIDPAGASGTAEMVTELTFPLIKDLGFDDLEVTSKGKLKQAGLKEAVLDADITEGDFQLEVNTDRLILEGEGKLGGVPLTARWTESFAADAPLRTEVSAQVPLINDQQLDTLGIIPKSDFLDGPVSSALEIALDPGGNGQIRTASNLTSATMTQSTLGWYKAAGEAGQAHVTLEIRDNDIVGLSKLDLKAGDLQFSGSARFPDDGVLKAEYELEEIFLGNSNLQGLRVKQQKNGGLEIDVAAGVLDIGPWLEEDDLAPEEQTEPDAESKPEQETTPLLLHADRLSQVYLGDGRYLSDVALDLRRSASGWERISINGRVPPEWSTHRSSNAETSAKSFSFDYKPSSDGGYSLLIEAEDTGAVARAFDWVDTIEGGRLVLKATMPGRLPEAPITGSVEAVDYRLVEAPGLAKMLSVASLTGITNVLNGQGLTFDRMFGDFTFEKGIITTPLIRAHGDSLGLTTRGTFDTNADEVDLVGTVVPAYSFNAVLGRVPLLGLVLTGGEGEGLLAFTYRLSGAAADPTITVNPLSVLAPGFLRNLLGTPNASDGAEEPTALPLQPNNER